MHTHSRLMLLSMLSLCFILQNIACAQNQSQPYIWIEAESSKSMTFKLVKAENHSGKAAILAGADAADTPVYADYEFTVPVDGDWYFYVRYYPWRMFFRWQFDGGAWANAVESRLDRDGGCWGLYSKVNLKAGKHTLRVETVSPETEKNEKISKEMREGYRYSGLDCFVLSKGLFRPTGKKKPDEPFDPKLAPEGWAIFDPMLDDFSSDTFFDWRNLDGPEEAGSKGFIQAKGNECVFEKTGEPVRLWGVCLGGGQVSGMTDVAMEHLCRRLAKVGVNCVRVHAASLKLNTPEQRYERMYRFHSIAKKHGIYTGWNWSCTAGGYNAARGYVAGPDYDEVIEVSKRLMTTKNPYTGMTLAQDPATALVELLDEDSLFWFTFVPYWTPYKKETMESFERAHFQWIVAKYGSIEKAIEAWGPNYEARWGDKDPIVVDDFANGRAGVYHATKLLDRGSKSSNQNRITDCAQFLTELMRNYYAKQREWLRSAGCRGLIYGSNWHVADERLLGPMDMYANMVGDAIARNNYFAVKQKPGGNSAAISKGDIYVSRTWFDSPAQAITTHIQAEGKPFMMTEGGWEMRNRFRAEEPFLQCAYSSLQGIDGIFPFQIDSPFWANKIDNKWPIQTPVNIGQYPALSFIYRKRLIKEAPTIFMEKLDMKKIYKREGAIVNQKAGLDIVKVGQGKADSDKDDNKGGFDMLSFYVGRIAWDFAEGQKNIRSPEIEKFINREAKTVRSITGELFLDYGKRILRVDAPCAQGVSGFLQAAGKQELSSVTIDSQNEYGSVMCVAFDLKPIAESKKIFIQMVTEEKNTGEVTEPIKHDFGKRGGVLDAEKVLEHGTSPVIFRKLAAKVTIKNPRVSTVWVLDMNGKKIEKLAASKTSNGISFTLLPDKLYYGIE